MTLQILCAFDAIAELVSEEIIEGSRKRVNVLAIIHRMILELIEYSRSKNASKFSIEKIRRIFLT